MENCLVTQLKGSVNNENLEKLGVIKFTLAEQSGTRRCDIATSGNFEMTIIGDAVFTDNTGTDNLGKHLTGVATGNIQKYLKNVSEGDVLEIKNKYVIVRWGANNPSELISSKISSLEWLTDLETLNFGVNHFGISLDLNTLTKYSSNIKTIVAINDTNCYGTIETMVENIFGKRTVADNLAMSVYGAKIKLNNTLLRIASTSTNITIAFTSSGATVTLGSTQIAEYDKDNGWTYSN